MPRNNLFFAALAVSSALASPALAGGDAAANPELPKEVQQMYCMVGEWRGSGEVQMGADKAKLTISISCEPASGGHAISCRSRFDGLPTGPHEETDLFGYDATTNTYHWFAVTNAGETHDHVASMPTSDTLTWVYKGSMGGKPFTETITFTFGNDSKRLDFESVGRAGKTTLFKLKARVHKK